MIKSHRMALKSPLSITGYATLVKLVNPSEPQNLSGNLFLPYNVIKQWLKDNYHIYSAQ